VCGGGGMVAVSSLSNITIRRPETNGGRSARVNKHNGYGNH